MPFLFPICIHICTFSPLLCCAQTRHCHHVVRTKQACSVNKDPPGTWNAKWRMHGPSGAGPGALNYTLMSRWGHLSCFSTCHRLSLIQLRRAAPRLAQALLTGICPAPLAQLKVKPFFHACHSTDTFDHHAHVWRTSSIWICCADAALVLVHPSIFVTHAYERRTCFCAEGCAPAHDDSIIGFLTHEPVFNEECFRYAWDK